MAIVTNCSQNISTPSVSHKIKSRKASRRYAGASEKIVEAARSKREPTEIELVDAVNSLCRDQLRPYGRLIRKRLAEVTSTTDVTAPDADVATLKRLCERSSRLHVEIDGEADWYAVVGGTLAEFIDIFSDEDSYSEDMWCAFASYLETREAEGMLQPGGRYVCAQALMSQHLAFFEGLSLGRVSHIVQIAMTSRKLLGYKDGTIVPYARSETAVKEQCAEQQCLIKKAKSPLATWDALRTCLRELLEDAREGGFPLSNVKRILRTRFKIDLSETALGHATVSELFKDVRVQDLCSVRLLDNGYFLFPEFEVPQAPEDLATQLDALHGQSVLSTTPYLVRGSSACVHIPGASTFNSFEGMSTFAAWDLTCIALDMNPTDVYVDTPNVPQPVAHYGSGSVVFNEIEGEQNTHATKSNMSDDIVSACGSTIDSIRDSHNCDVISSSSELDLTTSESSSLPSTPRELGGVTPSPNPWNGGFFTYDLRLAIEEASDSILDSDDEAADGDSRVRVVCHANQETQWPVTEIKVKNTFIEIDCHSPMVGTSVSVARQARSLPTTPWTRLSVNGTGESDLSPIVMDISKQSQLEILEVANHR